MMSVDVERILYSPYGKGLRLAEKLSCLLSLVPDGDRHSELRHYLRDESLSASGAYVSQPWRTISEVRAMFKRQSGIARISFKDWEDWFVPFIAILDNKTMDCIKQEME